MVLRQQNRNQSNRKMKSTSTVILLYITPLLVCLIYMHYKNFIYDGYKKHLIEYSSVWCRRDMNNSKLCTFKDVCYDPKLKSYIFFLSSSSVIKGISTYKDFQTIQLSSINFHNKFEANISVISVNNYHIKNAEYVKKALLFSRFKPDNIMHVIHDDLLPLFLTLEELCLGDMKLCEQSYRLIIHDDYSKGPYFNLYQLFSNFQPIILNQLSRSNVLCFEQLHMGLLQDSTFYQYGFNKPQGPIENVKLSHSDLSRFATFIRNKLNIAIGDDKTNIVLVSRKKSRRILNEKKLIQMLENLFQNQDHKKIVNVISLDLMENKTEVFVHELARASAFIGMHGAEMIFSIFLKSGSLVIELFPYGIQPNVVSFVKSLANIEGIHFNYISWKNTFKNLSVFHPDADPHHGGIHFLPQALQDQIQNIEEVPAVECCNNPMYLYYMYQDTWIHESFQEFLTKEIKTEYLYSQPYNTEKWFFPSVVSNVTCFYDFTRSCLNLSWSKPFNVKNEDTMYDVLVLESNSNVMKNILTENTTLEIHFLSNEFQVSFRVWITVIYKINRARSKDFFSEFIFTAF